MIGDCSNLSSLSGPPKTSVFASPGESGGESPHSKNQDELSCESWTSGDETSRRTPKNEDERLCESREKRRQVAALQEMARIESSHELWSEIGKQTLPGSVFSFGADKRR
jgi:hypothetical protein